MSQQHPTPAEMYQQFFGPAMFMPWSQVLLEYAAPEPGEQVLDLACGTGIVTRAVAARVGATGQVVGVDINPDMLAVARALPAPAGTPMSWQQGNAIALDLPDQAFDLVLCQQGLQFFPNRPAALREMRRVLRDGGRVALAAWQPLAQHPLYAALCQAIAGHLNVPPAAIAVPFSLTDAAEIRSLLAEAGFQHIAITPRSLDARFPSARQFVQLTVMAGAAVDPASPDADPARRAALVEAVNREIRALVERHSNGEILTMPTHWYMVVART